MRLIRTSKTVVVGGCLLFLAALYFDFWLSIPSPVSEPEKTGVLVLLAGSYEERAPVVVSLYNRGYSGQLLLTDDGIKRQWSRKHQRNLYTTERAEEDLVKNGVPRNSIVKLPFGRSGTVYDALEVRKYIIKHDIRSICLVTSDYHTRRALWIFERVLRHQPASISIAPANSESSFFAMSVLEYVKLVYYRIRFSWSDFDDVKI